jgi:hypothetical protein
MNILSSINHNTPLPFPRNRFRPFSFTIIGTNFIGSASNYPISFNPNASVPPTITYGTYGNITNFRMSQANGKSFTIYFKNTVSSPQYGKYIFCFSEFALNIHNGGGDHIMYKYDVSTNVFFSRLNFRTLIDRVVPSQCYPPFLLPKEK